MAAKKNGGSWYAWSTIHATGGSAAVGDKVSASSLGLTDDQFQELVDVGSVRKSKYPVPAGVVDLSPREHRLKTLAEQSDPDLEEELIEAAEAEEEAASS